MAQLQLPRDEKIALRAQAHHLDPVVLLGASGLTDAVKKEIDRELNAHGLIKVRVPSDEREERIQIYETLAEELNAAKIQLIGKLLVLYRPIPKKEAKEKVKATEHAKKVRKTGAKARNNRKRLSELLEQKRKGAPKSLPWAKTIKKGKTPKGAVKAVSEKGKTLGSRMVRKAK